MQSVIGANWFDTYAGPDSGLPLVGPLALFFRTETIFEFDQAK